MSLERQRQLLGLPSTAMGLDRYPGLVEKAARVCVVEEFELCVEDHVIHRMAIVWRSFERQFALFGQLGLELDEGPLREARELTVKCLTFRLKVESTGTLDVADGGYESTVTSEVTLRFNPDESRISGEAPLVNTAFEFKSPCGATSIKGGGDFEVNTLRILTARPDQFDSGEINFLLSYLPGATSESAKIKICGSSGGRLPFPRSQPGRARSSRPTSRSSTPTARMAAATSPLTGRSSATSTTPRRSGSRSRATSSRLAPSSSTTRLGSDRRVSGLASMNDGLPHSGSPNRSDPL